MNVDSSLNIPQFNDTINDLDLEQEFENKIHLRLQKRNGKKCITSVEGLKPYEKSKKLVIENFMKSCKKNYCCNGHVDDMEQGIVCLQGDHRQEILEMLTTKYGIKKDNIVIHGY